MGFENLVGGVKNSFKMSCLDKISNALLVMASLLASL